MQKIRKMWMFVVVVPLIGFVVMGCKKHLQMSALSKAKEQKLLQTLTNPKDARIVVVDMQRDFTVFAKGSLAVPGTDKGYLDSVKKSLQFFKKRGYVLYATQDWHPKTHISFASNHKEASGRTVKPFTLRKLYNGTMQVMWPDHCVQETKGAKLYFPSFYDRVVKKGYSPLHDSYSGFKDHGGGKTGLAAMLNASYLPDRYGKAKLLIVFGLATDYCVKATVIDGLAAGFKVVLLRDLSRAVGPSPDKEKQAVEEMRRRGAIISSMTHIKKYLVPSKKLQKSKGSK